MEKLDLKQLTARAALTELRSLANPAAAAVLQRFFKTGRGDYGAGDVFLGIRVPAIRKLAGTYRELPGAEVSQLLRAKEHEARLLAVIILTQQYARSDAARQQELFDFYLAHAQRINNWDLVDLSAPQIVGAHLHGRSTRILDELAASENLWARRIAIIATQYFIRRNDFRPTLRVAGKLLADEHDLIHKAVGWMLREVGDRDRAVEEGFLQQHYRKMPRTMLRYAIEKFPPALRAKYMKK